MKRADFLRRAQKCVCGGRDSDYGAPEDNFGTIAKLWTIYRGTTFTAKDVAMMMALLKIARIRNGAIPPTATWTSPGTLPAPVKLRILRRRTGAQTNEAFRRYYEDPRGGRAAGRCGHRRQPCPGAFHRHSSVDHTSCAV